MTVLAFVDTETTGLDPDHHEIWEVGLILRTPNEEGDDYLEQDFVWQLPVDLSKADAYALNIGRFHERRLGSSGPAVLTTDAATASSIPELWRSQLRQKREQQATVWAGGRVTEKLLAAWCHQFSLLTWGAHLVGAVVSFDEERLRKLLRANGACPGWHYHLVDVEALVAGKLGLAPPWDSRELWKAIGVNEESYERHTALGDALMARDIYDRVMGSGEAT